jgi:hypothetical protein
MEHKNRQMIYDFTAILADCEEIPFETGEALYEAGCDDGTQWSGNGVAGIHFSREAVDLPSAIRSAIADIQKAGCHVAEIRIDKHALVSI